MTLSYDQFTHNTVRPNDGTKPRYLMIWDALIEDADFTTPEGRYTFDIVLRDFIATIEPDALREHYTSMFRQLRAAEFGVGRMLGELEF